MGQGNHIAATGKAWAQHGEKLIRGRASACRQVTLRRCLAAAVLGTMLAGPTALPAAASGPGVSTNVRKAMQDGAAAMAARKFTAAAADYKLVTRALPKFAGGYVDLGLALEQAGQLDQARAALRKSLELHPGLRGANLFLGIIAYRQNRFRDAETRLTRETRIDPRDAKAFMWLGVCYLAQDNPKAAIPPLNRAHALDPKNADILYHRGHAYLMMANASYAAMFKLNPDSMRVHQVLGEAYAKAYRTQEAISEFQIAIKMAPHEPGLHEELGDQYWVAGELHKAARAYRAELRIDPNSVASMYKLGSLLVRTMKPAQGVPLLRKALREDPSLIDANYHLGIGLMMLHKNRQAIQQFKKTIAANPTNSRAQTTYYKLAMLYRKLGNHQAETSAMQNFLRLKNAQHAKRIRHTARIVRDRTSLPVERPQKSRKTAHPDPKGR